MSSGYFPYNLSGESRNTAVKALKGMKKISTQSANNAMCGGNGQFDNSFSDGYSIGRIDLAIHILCEEFCLKEVEEYEPKEEQMETHFDKVKNAANFCNKTQGYVDINLVSRMTGIHAFVVKNVLTQIGFKKIAIEGQYVKNSKKADGGLQEKKEGMNNVENEIKKEKI